MTLRVPDAVNIFFTAGYGDDGAAAPANLKIAVLVVTGGSYEYREALTAEQVHKLDRYDDLIWSERVLDYDPTK
jgi:predicted metal-dependent peptidase